VGKKNRYHPATPGKGGRSGFARAGSNGGGFFNIAAGGDFPEEMKQMLSVEQLQGIRRSRELSRNPEPLTEADAAVLRAALAPLLRDLTATGMSLPDIREETRFYRERSVCGWISDLGGSGQGISVMVDNSPAEQVRELAEQIRDWATDVQVDPERPPEWPLCPEHRRAHGIYADVRDDTAVWVCPVTDRVVSPIGSLTM
jgi:hypothetical protein